MRIAVVGATGNTGTALLRALEREPRVASVLGIARRMPERWCPSKVQWLRGDVVDANFAELLRGCDVVVHLAWLIQPSHDVAVLERVNVEGSRRVFEGAVAAGVGTIVYASSVGAYSAAPLDGQLRDESWPTDGIPPNDYSLQKAAVEHLLDGIELRAPEVRVVRVRPALVFQRDAASHIRRLFAGPLLPRWILRAHVPVAPDIDGLVTQCVHADDLADAYRRTIVDTTARGAYNVVAEPLLDADAIRVGLGASRSVRVRSDRLRRATDLAWRAHLEPIPADWLDLAVMSPLLDSGRIRRELGWWPRRSSVEALRELVLAMGEGAGLATPPLDPHAGGPARLRELATGIGRRDRP